MPVMTYGEQLYGKVDRVPHAFYLATKFFHVNFLPLFPLQTYLVLDDSDHDGTFQGKPVGLQLKSVVVGYLRGWLGATALITSTIAVASALSLLIPPHPAGLQSLLAGLCAIAAPVGCALLLKNDSRFAILGQAGMHCLLIFGGLSISAIVVSNPALAMTRCREVRLCIPTLCIANSALLLYGLLRLATTARQSRRAAVLESLTALVQRNPPPPNRSYSDILSAHISSWIGFAILFLVLALFAALVWYFAVHDM